MGSCGSVHRNSETDMKLRLSFGSKTDKLAIPPSPIKEKPKNGNFRIDDIALKSQWSPSRSTTTFRDYGSKEEAFFDSKACLDSDCEDDFYSVNGEFTPSHGSTPVHHSFGTSTVSKTPSENRIYGSSPTEKKKKLLELFRETVSDGQEGEENTSDTSQNMGNEKKEVKTTIHDLLPKSAQSTPYISGANSVCSSERTMNEEPISIREKPVKSSVQCCLPSLASCRSFSERRRKMSPAIVANRKP